MDLILGGCVQAMAELLNLFLDEKNLVMAGRSHHCLLQKTQCHGCGVTSGVTYAQLIRHWVLDVFQMQELPHYKYKQSLSSVLDNEDVSQDIKLVGINKPSNSECMAHCWLGRLGLQYGKQPNGMYIDGHEHEDVVQYMTGFVQSFKQYECCFHLFDDNSDELLRPCGFPVPEAAGHFHLILVTHDKLT